MNRTFDAASLVTLPRLSAADAVALGNQLLTAAKEKKSLGKPVQSSLDKVGIATGKLEQAMTERPTPSAADSARARIADNAEDAAWRALSAFLTGWSLLPESLPQSRQAKAALESLFPDGLAFTQLPFRQEWAESEARLKKMHKDGTLAQVKDLGGELFLKTLDAAHAEYGKALGIKEALSPAPSSAGIRDPLEAFSGAVRTYALKVAAQVEDGDARSLDLANMLLQPLTSWQARPSQPGSSPPPPERNPPPPGGNPPPAQ